MHAFPNVHDPKTGSMSHGMTLRDYFAAKALQALIKENDDRFPTDEIVKGAWLYADEMLKARDL